MQDIQPYGDNIIPVIPSYDTPTHTVQRPFCFDDDTCPCHEDQENIQVVNEHVQNGLLTPAEATRTVQGRQI